MKFVTPTSSLVSPTRPRIRFRKCALLQLAVGHLAAKQLPRASEQLHARPGIFLCVGTAVGTEIRPSGPVGTKQNPSRIPIKTPALIPTKPCHTQTPRATRWPRAHAQTAQQIGWRLPQMDPPCLLPARGNRWPLNLGFSIPPPLHRGVNTPLNFALRHWSCRREEATSSAEVRCAEDGIPFRRRRRCCTRPCRRRKRHSRS